MLSCCLSNFSFLRQDAEFRRLWPGASGNERSTSGGHAGQSAAAFLDLGVGIARDAVGG